MSLGETWLPRPITGRWTIRGYPDVIHVNGRRFRKARWKDTHAGVVEQYREDVADNSRHLKVRDDGTWLIDHTDRHNPDHGKPIEHFFADHPLGQVLAGVAVVAGVSLAAAGLVAGIAALIDADA